MAPTTRKQKSFVGRRGPPRKAKRAITAEKEENGKDILGKKLIRKVTPLPAKSKSKKPGKKLDEIDLEAKLYRELDCFEENDRFEGRQIPKPSEFVRGSFVVSKADYFNQVNHPQLWRIDAPDMIQKYVPSRRRNSRNLYISTKTFSTWGPQKASDYYPVSVKYIKYQRGMGDCTVEFENGGQ